MASFFPTSGISIGLSNPLSIIGILGGLFKKKKKAPTVPATNYLVPGGYADLTNQAMGGSDFKGQVIPTAPTGAPKWYPQWMATLQALSQLPDTHTELYDKGMALLAQAAGYAPTNMADEMMTGIIESMNNRYGSADPNTGISTPAEATPTSGSSLKDYLANRGMAINSLGGGTMAQTTQTASDLYNKVGVPGYQSALAGLAAAYGQRNPSAALTGSTVGQRPVVDLASIAKMFGGQA